MSMHLGAPCEPVVAVGEHVERGQLVGDVDAMVSAPVHSPVSGKVDAITRRLTAGGSIVTAVEVVPDEVQDLASFVLLPEEHDLKATVRAAGLVGLGGAAFPSAVKLSPAKDTPVSTVILNGCECEPYLTCDHRVMVEHAERVVAGGRLIADAVGASRVVIGVESNKPDAIAALRDEANGGVDVLELPTRYPQGAEKQLIWAVLRKEVPKGKLPAATGALVHNVGTAAAVADAVEHRKPLIERVVTVTGAVRRPGNYRVLLGTLISDLVEFAGGLEDDVERVVAGGPMTGAALGRLDVPVQKGTSGVLALRAADCTRAIDDDQPCIRCGRCVEACPMFLQPFALGSYALLGDWNGVERYHGLDCIECGSCGFICPTRRPLVQLIRSGKQALLAKGVKP